MAVRVIDYSVVVTVRSRFTVESVRNKESIKDLQSAPLKIPVTKWALFLRPLLQTAMIVKVGGIPFQRRSIHDKGGGIVSSTNMYTMIVQVYRSYDRDIPGIQRNTKVFLCIPL